MQEVFFICNIDSVWRALTRENVALEDEIFVHNVVKRTCGPKPCPAFCPWRQTCAMQSSRLWACSGLRRRTLATVWGPAVCGLRRRKSLCLRLWAVCPATKRCRSYALPPRIRPAVLEGMIVRKSPAIHKGLPGFMSPSGVKTVGPKPLRTKCIKVHRTAKTAEEKWPTKLTEQPVPCTEKRISDVLQAGRYGRSGITISLHSYAKLWPMQAVWVLSAALGPERASFCPGNRQAEILMRRMKQYCILAQDRASAQFLPTACPTCSYNCVMNFQNRGLQ